LSATLARKPKLAAKVVSAIEQRQLSSLQVSLHNARSHGPKQISQHLDCPKLYTVVLR